MRTFSLVEGTSDKFWNIDVAGTSVTVHYGRTGTAGQRNTKEFDTPSQAAEHAAKQIAGKVAKGYLEGAPSAESIEPTEVKVPQPATTPPATTSPVTPAAAAPTAAPAAAPAVEPPTAPIDFGTDGLGLVMPALVRASITGEVPAATLPPRADRAFSGPTEAAWATAHVIVENGGWHTSHHFTDLPFDEVPYDEPERAAWWDWWGFATETNRWGREEQMALKQKNSYATRHAAAEPGGPQQHMSDRDTEPLLAVAARLALAGPEATFDAFLVQEGTVSIEAALALRTLVVPHLSPERRAAFERVPVRPLAPTAAGDVPYNRFVAARMMLLGRDQELLTELRDGLDQDIPVTLEFLHAVDDIDTRLDLIGARDDLYTAHAAAQLLWLLGPAALPLIRTGLRYEFADKEDVVATVTMLTQLVHGPAAVDTFVDLALDSRARGVARDWLITHPTALQAWAAAGATPNGKAKDLISSVVREARMLEPASHPIDSPGFLADLVAHIEAEGSLPALGVDGTLPPWWVEAVAGEAATEVAPSKIKVPATIPSFAQPGALPALVVDGARLSEAQGTELLLSAARGIGEEELTPRPLVAAARERMAPHVRDAVASALLDGFLASGAKPADRAFLMAAGFLGHDGFALHLGPLVREWPGQSQHQRAVLGLDVLAATGTDTALGIISGIANKSKFKGVQKAARESLEKLAALKGLTVHQLEDRVVPDGGLDERGHRHFSYGPRRFRASLTPAGKLQVRDLDADDKPTGKPRTGLPAANSKDDAELVTAAKADFAVLRKTVTDLAKVQTARLEQAMVSGRSWTGAEHAELLAQHPILNSLVRPLVWSITDPTGTRTLARVTEEHTYLTIDDDDFEMPAEAVVTLAHRLSLSEAEADAWRQHLVDYDLTSPVEQLDRAVFGLPEGQSGTALAGLPSGSINPLSLVGALEKLGWRRGNPADAGVVSFLSLTFESLGLAVVLDISDGLWTGMIGESGDQRLEKVLVGPADQPQHMWYVEERDTTWLDWTEVDPLVVSETRRSIAALEEKMQ